MLNWHSSARLAFTVGALALVASCGGSSGGAEPGNGKPDGGNIDGGEVSVPSVSAEAVSVGSCEVEPGTEFVERMDAGILSRYAEGAPIDTAIVSSDCVGASECVVHTTETGFLSLTRVVGYPDGEFVLERELGDTPELTGEVLDTCFDAAGIAPTPDDVALVQTAMWSSFLSLEVSELPPEGVAGLSEAALNDFPLDFDNYEGPVVEEVDGVRTVFFVAEDQVANFYVVQTVLDPDVRSKASVVYVG